jgi:hypothetical protein
MRKYSVYLFVVYTWWFCAATGTVWYNTTTFLKLFNMDVYITEIFMLFRNIFGNLVHIVNSHHILTSDDRFSQFVQLPWCCNSWGCFRLMYLSPHTSLIQETTDIMKLWKTNKIHSPTVLWQAVATSLGMETVQMNNTAKLGTLHN